MREASPFYNKVFCKCSAVSILNLAYNYMVQILQCSSTLKVYDLVLVILAINSFNRKYDFL